MARDKQFLEFDSFEAVMAKLWNTEPNDEAMKKLVKPGKNENEKMVYCPDGKVHVLKAERDAQGQQTYTLSKEEEKKPKRTFWDSIKHFFGFGESRQQYEERLNKWQSVVQEGISYHQNNPDVTMNFNDNESVTRAFERKKIVIPKAATYKKVELDIDIKPEKAPEPVKEEPAKVVIPKASTYKKVELVIDDSQQEKKEEKIAVESEKAPEAVQEEAKAEPEQKEQPRAEKQKKESKPERKLFDENGDFIREEPVEKKTEMNPDWAFNKDGALKDDFLLDDDDAPNEEYTVIDEQNEEPEAEEEETELDFTAEESKPVHTGERDHSNAGFEGMQNAMLEDKELKGIAAEASRIRLELSSEVGALTRGERIDHQAEVKNLQELAAYRAVTTMPDYKDAFVDYCKTNHLDGGMALENWSKKVVPADKIEACIPNGINAHREFLNTCNQTGGKTLLTKLGTMQKNAEQSKSASKNEPVAEGKENALR